MSLELNTKKVNITGKKCTNGEILEQLLNTKSMVLNGKAAKSASLTPVVQAIFNYIDVDGNSQYKVPDEMGAYYFDDADLEKEHSWEIIDSSSVSTSAKYTMTVYYDATYDSSTYPSLGKSVMLTKMPQFVAAISHTDDFKLYYESPDIFKGKSTDRLINLSNTITEEPIREMLSSPPPDIQLSEVGRQAIKQIKDLGFFCISRCRYILLVSDQEIAENTDVFVSYLCIDVKMI